MLSGRTRVVSRKFRASVAILVIALTGSGGALADAVVPLTFNCDVYARIVNWDAPGGLEVNGNGVNSVSVTAPWYSALTATIAFNSGASGASLHAQTCRGLSITGSVGTVTPGQLTIGTSSALPAGTPLTLHIEETWAHEEPWNDYYGSASTLSLARGTTTILQITKADIPLYGVPVTRDVPVIAGETLAVSYYAAQTYSPANVTFTASGVPEPGGLALLTIGAVAVLRRRG